MNTLGMRISHHRGRLQLSQLELAEKLGVSRQSVSKWETDTSTPELEKLVEMGKIFQITLDELVTGAEEPQEGEIVPPTPTSVSQSPNNRQIAGWILLGTGLLSSVLGILFNLLALIVGLILVVIGVIVLMSKRNPALVITWWLLLLPLFWMRQITSVSLSMVFNAYPYEMGMWTHLIIAFSFWALIVVWTICAMKSPRFHGHKWLAIGWGLMLVWADRLFGLVHMVLYWDMYMWSYFAPLGYVNILLSIAIPVVVVVATLRSKKSK